MIQAIIETDNTNVSAILAYRSSENILPITCLEACNMIANSEASTTGEGGGGGGGGNKRLQMTHI